MQKSLTQIIRAFSVFAIAIMIFGCAEMQSRSSMPGPVGDQNVASGTQGDTLEACLGRIPSNSSDSQQMFAKLSCQRDDKTRQSIEAVPGK